MRITNYWIWQKDGVIEILFSIKSVDIEGKYKAGACVLVIKGEDTPRIKIPVLFAGDADISK